MATQKINPHDLEAAPAGADLSQKQFFLGKLNEAGELVLAGAGDVGYSIQEGAPQGAPATYAVSGRAKAVAGGNIKAGEPVSAGANGKLVAATPTKVEEEKVKVQGSRVIGVALESGEAGDIIAYRQVPYGGRA